MAEQSTYEKDFLVCKLLPVDGGLSLKLFTT